MEEAWGPGGTRPGDHPGVLTLCPMAWVWPCSSQNQLDPSSAHPGPWASRTPDSLSATRQGCLTHTPPNPPLPCAMRCRKTSCRRWSTGEVTWK